MTALGELQAAMHVRIGDALYLALPADDALRARIGSLGRGESVRRPLLGVAIADDIRDAVAAPDVPVDVTVVRGTAERTVKVDLPVEPSDG